MNWGERLQELRLREGVSKYATAKAVGCTEAYLTRVERGEVTPSIRRVEEILNFLGYELKIEEVR